MIQEEKSLKAGKKLLALLLTVCMLLCMLPTVAFASGSDYLKIAMLDSGRKYFSADWVKAFLYEAKADGYTHVMLAVGNDGMRFLLDDMSLTVGGKTYSSNAVASAIRSGNNAYTTASSGEWTESEMDEFFATAKKAGIEIIPLLNSPGHMDSVLYAASSLTGTNCSYNGSSRTIDVTNDTAVRFSQAFLQKYVDYFAGKGCRYFNFGADEYANDRYTSGSMGFGSLQNSGKYGYFIKYVNELAAMVKQAGMTPIAFNDGIEFANKMSASVGSTTYTFDRDIVVCYWSGGWSGYTPRTAANLASDGFRIINTTGDFYYVLGKNDSFDNGYTYASNWSNYKVCGTSLSASSVIGGMFCMWSDYPGAETQTQEAKKIRLPLRAMAQRMKGESVVLDENELVSGGFKADGTINAATVSDEATGVSVTASGLTGITVAAVDKGTELDGKKVAGAWNIELTTANGSYTDSATVSIPVGKEWLSYKLTGGVLESDGTTVTSDPNSKVENGVLTFTAPHFSTVVVLAEEKQQEITVTVGGTVTLDPVDGEFSGDYTNDYVTVKTETKDKTATPYYERAALDEGEFYLSNNANDTAPSVKVTLAAMGNGQYSLFSNAYYRYPDATYNTFIIGFGYWSYDDARDRSPVGLTISESETGAVTISREVTSGSHKTTSWLTLSSGSFDASENSTMLYLYKLVQPTASKQTTISFTGKKAGTTQVLIGDTLYTVRVVDKAPDGAMTASSLKIEYWITNAKVYEGKNDSTNPYYLLQSTDAVSDDGVAVQDVALKVGYSPFDNYTAEMYYWQAMRLDANNIQTGSEGDDETADGTTFTHVRYHAGAWQYKTLDGTWHYFLSTDQAVAYYL